MNGPSQSWHTNLFSNRSLVQLAYAALIVALLVVGRAFSTDNISLPMRTLMWSIVVGLVIGQARLLTTLIKPKLSFPGCAEIVSLMGTSFLTAGELALLKYTPILPKAHDPYFEFVLFLIPPVFILGGGALILDKLNKVDVDTVQATVENKQPSDILAVQAQEHYLLLTTVDGTRIRRGRFRDQVAKLQDVDGIQVHRSWWVARAAVSKVLKRKRDYTLQLVSGETVPVARSKVALLKESGWI